MRVQYGNASGGNYELVEASPVAGFKHQQSQTFQCESQAGKEYLARLELAPRHRSVAQVLVAAFLEE